MGIEKRLASNDFAGSDVFRVSAAARQVIKDSRADAKPGEGKADAGCS